MKALLLFISFTTFFLKINVLAIRNDYKQAVLSEEKTQLLHKKLAIITKSDDKVLVAYKGAVTTLIAKDKKGIKAKKEFLKKGISLIEYAAENKPKNIEIRFIRLTVQQNIPKFLKYNKDIESDKAFILENINTIKSSNLKQHIKGYILQSQHFSKEEKKLIS